MPGVRYGPDIADDAAFIMNNLVQIRDMRKKGQKISKADALRETKMLKLAKDIFGVNQKDIDKGRFGDLGSLAQYSVAGRNPKGKPYSRAKMAKSWRTGKVMKRKLRDEYVIRGEGPKGRQLGPDTSDPFGGATYLGRTKTKRFDALAAKSYRRARKNGVQVGKAKVRTSDAAGIDSLNIARTGKFLPGIDGPRGSARTGSTIRPPKAKSAARASQRTRESSIKGAGKGAGNTSSTGPSKPKTPSKPVRAKKK
jgi:hypothetical protein